MRSCPLLCRSLYVFWLIGVMQTTSQITAEPQAEPQAEPEKIGAGLLLCSDGQVLLLRRNSKHNDKTWGLPGGNAEPSDAGVLLSTATREAWEELGSVPAFEVKAQILTKRGKRDQKHYTVFVCDVPASTRANYLPNLNLAEHSEWRWWPWLEVAHLGGSRGSSAELHPVVKQLVKSHAAEVQRVLQTCQVPAAGAAAAGASPGHGGG